MKYHHALSLICTGLTLTLNHPIASADDPSVGLQGDLKQLIAGPPTKADFPQWIQSLKLWREFERKRLGISSTEYQRNELMWTRKSFIQPQMMAEDRYFYDPIKREYTVDKYLNDLRARYGGIDSVLIWPTYPNIGIDERNQHDHLRDMPGGYDGLRKMVDQFHVNGVKVLFPIMPWDIGTKDEGIALPTALARSMKAVNADGMNGDTMNFIPKAFRDESDNIGHPLAFEPENGLQGDDAISLSWTNMNWGYWWPYKPIPGVSRYKWLEPNHLTHVCNRWMHDRTDDMQYAFFNGEGYESWENIWSIWNQATPRDAEALRRIGAIYRSFGNLLFGSDWEPHTPTIQQGIYASRFRLHNQTLYTIVNRTDTNIGGPQLVVSHQKGQRYFDLWRAVEIFPDIVNGNAALYFEMEANGFGSVLVTTENKLDAGITAFLKKMQPNGGRTLASFSHTWRALQQTIAPIKPTAIAKSAPDNMAAIPTQSFRFKVTGVEIEKSEGVDVQYPWENEPSLTHDHVVAITAYAIDKYPVTNADFKKFLDATKYRPADAHNFLKDWSNGTYPAGWDKKPVTWVSIEDSRAYADWAGKRLPHEWEWQLAAQSNDSRLYPWGNRADGTMMPTFEHGRTRRAPTDVDAFDKTPSPYGVHDLVGNVWQWTDEVLDSHTRTAILKGGSYYRPDGSGWYFPQAHRVDQHGKYLLLAPSKDRAGTIGFRCVVDLNP